MQVKLSVSQTYTMSVGYLKSCSLAGDASFWLAKTVKVIPLMSQKMDSFFTDLPLHEVVEIMSDCILSSYVHLPTPVEYLIILHIKFVSVFKLPHTNKSWCNNGQFIRPDLGRRIPIHPWKVNVWWRFSAITAKTLWGWRSNFNWFRAFYYFFIGIWTSFT